MADERKHAADADEPMNQDPCIRAENEDDDGYDPYSDRRPDPEPLFERDPWAETKRARPARSAPVPATCGADARGSTAPPAVWVPCV